MFAERETKKKAAVRELGLGAAYRLPPTSYGPCELVPRNN